MKIKTSTIAVAILFATTINLAHADFKERLITKYPSAKGAKVDKAFDGFWSVIKNGEVVYFNDQLTIMINGDVIDLQNQKSITAKLKEENQPKIDLALLPIKDAIKFSSGQHKLYIFSDPDCPYCRRLQGELSKLSNVDIYIFPMPIASLHPNSTAISQNIWCQANKAKAWSDYTESGTMPTESKCENPVAKNIELATQLRINGTPAIIFEDGTLVPGALSAAQINDKIQTIAKK